MQQHGPLGDANADCGHIPTRKEYSRGGYEVKDLWIYVCQRKTDDSGEEKVVEAGKYPPAEAGTSLSGARLWKEEQGPGCRSVCRPRLAMQLFL